MITGRDAPWPTELQEALASNPAASERFLALPPSHQREYLKWIHEAKRSDTRARRIQATIDRLLG